MHFPEEPAALRAPAQHRAKRAPQAEPSRKIEPALHPGEYPGYGAQVGHALRGAAVRGTGAELEIADLVDRRRLAPEDEELRIVVHQRLVSGKAGRAHLLHRLAPLRHRRAGPVRRVNPQHDAIGHLLEDAVGQVGIVVPGRQHLPLLGDANASVPQSGGLCEDRLGGRSSAASDAAAAPVKQGQPNTARTANGIDRLLRLLERPGCRRVAAILVAVGVAEHHELVGRLEARQREELFQDFRRPPQIVERLKKRGDRAAMRMPISEAARPRGYPTRRRSC